MTPPPIQINWETSAPPLELEEAAISRALRSFLDGLGYSASGITLLVSGDAALAELNSTHRGNAATTDILSWSYRSATDPKPELLGELAVSLERVRSQAVDHGWDAQTELLRLLAHGCAHLAGFEHRTAEEDEEMKRVELKLLEGIGLTGIYPA